MNLIAVECAYFGKGEEKETFYFSVCFFGRPRERTFASKPSSVAMR